MRDTYAEIFTASAVDATRIVAQLQPIHPDVDSYEIGCGWVVYYKREQGE